MICIRTQRNKNKTYAFCAFVFAVFTLLYALSFSDTLTPGLWHLFGFFWLGCASFVLIRFYLTEYTYSLLENEFIIIKHVGEKSTKVCHLDLDTVKRVYTAEEWKKLKKSERKINVYNYNADFSPQNSCVLVFELDRHRDAVKFQAMEEIGLVIRGRTENQ